jgi:hypothetical protein
LFVLGRFANSRAPREKTAESTAPQADTVKPHEGPIGPIGFLRD